MTRLDAITRFIYRAAALGRYGENTPGKSAMSYTVANIAVLLYAGSRYPGPFTRSDIPLPKPKWKTHTHDTALDRLISEGLIERTGERNAGESQQWVMTTKGWGIYHELLK